MVPVPSSKGDRSIAPDLDPGQAALQWKLWIYTNYDCNLRCTYCVAKSSPDAPRRAIGLDNARRLVDEAVALGFGEVLFTGGEPFILEEIYDMLAYASARVRTSVLTNGMLLKGRRLERLQDIGGDNDNLIVQVSLDGGSPEYHDAYRGQGTWQKTVDGIRLLLSHGLHVRLSTTETPANSAHLEEICQFHRTLGIPENDHFIRPLAKRGYATEGIELDKGNLAPEVTVNRDGVFWHPLSTEADMQVTKSMFPLQSAVECIQEQLNVLASTGQAPLTTFT